VPLEQFGFREQSEVSEVARITDFVTHGFSLQQHAGMALLDIKKAYDTVCLNGFLYKLISLYLPNYSLFFLRSYLKVLTFTVHLNDTNSSPKPTPPVFLRVPYYRHYFPFTFPTFCALCTSTSLYRQMT
jgi:hypothetical protein